MKIVMTGMAGDIGSLRIARENCELMRRRFSPSFLRSFERLGEGAAESFDGVYQQLWRLGAEAGSGLSVMHAAIPVRQETIEICELTETDPYGIETSGRIYLAEDDAVITDGVVIGHLTDGAARTVQMSYGLRYLTEPRENPRTES
ncbi:MAG: hypothetical protein IJS22_09265 [Lachnospiraceae bacterium]|nr:hypothetical protein [Lachnospiraceae bacterium]